MVAWCNKKMLQKRSCVLFLPPHGLKRRWSQKNKWLLLRKSALGNLWGFHPHALVQCCITTFRAAQAQVGAPRAKKALHLAVVISVLAGRSKAWSTARSQSCLAGNATCHVSLLETAPKAVGRVPTVCHNLWESSIPISTSKLVHQGLVVSRARPREVGRNFKFGLFFLCPQLMKFQTACSTSALIIWKLFCNTQCQQAKAPESLRGESYWKIYDSRCNTRHPKLRSWPWSQWSMDAIKCSAWVTRGLR